MEFPKILRENVIVSSKARYNIKFLEASITRPNVEVDFDDGNGLVEGRMYGLGAIVQLYNTDPSKGMKGIEYPNGEITFDINMNLYKKTGSDDNIENITDSVTPRLWNYKINIGDNWGYTYSEGEIPNRSMHFGAYTSHNDGFMPYGVKTGNPDRAEGEIYNSGKVKMEQEKNQLHVSIDQYEINGEFPKYNEWYDEGYNIKYKENEGCFSSIYFQVFVPTDIENGENIYYGLELTEENMEIQSESGEIVKEQMKNDDDTVQILHQLAIEGYYSHFISIYELDDNPANNSDISQREGKARKGINQEFLVRVGIHQDMTNEKEIKSINKLVKFDGDGIEPTKYSEDEEISPFTDKMQWREWYVAKKDGTNWVSEEERNSAKIEDLVIYDTLEDLKKTGATCVGIYLESQGGQLSLGVRDYYISVKFKFKDTAKVGKTYGIMQDSIYWEEELDRKIQTVTNPDAEYPKPVFLEQGQQYIKTQYDENGNIVIGTHYRNYNWGNSILALGANATISTSVATTTDTGEIKTNFDIGKKETEVEFKVEPSLLEIEPNLPTGISGVNVKVMDILPPELTYVYGSSNYGDPEIVENDDGTTTLIWQIENCTVGKMIEPITFKTNISLDAQNGTTLKNTAIIEPDQDKIGLISTEFRTAECGIQITNLSSHMLYKEVNTPVIEKNGEIKYEITYANKTDAPVTDFQLLDILPYNGDSRGTTFNGTYTLENVKLMTEEELNLNLFVTEDESVKSMTAKDEGIGTSSIWTSKNFEETLNINATGFAIKGEIPKNSSLKIEITLKTQDNMPKDVYYNSVTAQTSKETEVITSTDVKAEVITRMIRGIVWNDTNRNGIKDENETGASNIEMKLKNSDGSEVVNINGQEVTNVFTNEQGEYEFINLQKGEYIVEIVSLQENYRLTTPNVGNDTKINSKFQKTEEGKNESYVITKLSNANLPNIVEDNVNAGLVLREAQINSTIEKTSTVETITDKNQEIEYTINYTTKISEYQGNAQITIVDYLPYKIDEEKSKLDGGIYDENTQTITWNLSENGIDTVANGEKTINIQKTIKVVFLDLDTKQNKVSNRVTGKIELQNPAKEDIVENTKEIPTKFKISIDVTKKWEDNENEYLKRPKSIIIQVKNGNVVEEEKTISEPENWKCTFTELDKYDENGDEITYTIDEKEVNEGELYNYTKEIGNLTDGLDNQDEKTITITNKMTKIPGTVVVKYLDINTNEEIENRVNKTGIVGENFDVTGDKKDIKGYTLVKEPAEKTGKYTVEQQEKIYYYAKNTKVIVKYLEKGTNKFLTPEAQYEINGYVGKDYETEQKEIDGYTFIESTNNTKGKMTEDPIEVIYYYGKSAKATVQHIDKETGTILKQETEEGIVGDIFKTHAENFDGYVLVEAPENPDVIMTEEEQIVKYYYAHVSAGVLEKHIDEITGELLYSEQHEGNEGDYYEIPSKEFEGYDLVTEKLPTNAKGEMTQELIEVKYYYIKKASVRVEYIDKQTNEKLTEDVIINGHENDDYETEAKTFEGYSEPDIPENAIGKMLVTKNPDGTYNTETVVTYYYAKPAGEVKEIHIDVDTNEVLAEEVHKGKVGSDYEILSREFEGYELVEDRLPTNSKGQMTEEEITVIYYYKKIAKVKVEYIDKDTGEKLDEEEIKGHIGDPYETENKQFDGYELIEIPLNSTGEMTEEEIVVKYYYQRKAEVEVQYIEKSTGKELAEKDLIKGKIGEKYETKPKDIEYYKLVGKTENTKGEMQKDKIVVKYYYEKQYFNLAIDKWVSSVQIDGISQIAQSYETRDEIYKIDVYRKKANTSDIKITYKIRISNTGEIEGKVNRITEIIPEGYSFNQEDNQIQWELKDGILTTEALKDEVIKPGEYKEIEIILTWNKGEANFGEKNNTVILAETSNPANFEDINSDDDSSVSQMILAIATGLDTHDKAIVNKIVMTEFVLVIGLGIVLLLKRKNNK